MIRVLQNQTPTAETTAVGKGGGRRIHQLLIRSDNTAHAYAGTLLLHVFGVEGETLPDLYLEVGKVMVFAKPIGGFHIGNASSLPSGTVFDIWTSDTLADRMDVGEVRFSGGPVAGAVCGWDEPGAGAPTGAPVLVGGVSGGSVVSLSLPVPVAGETSAGAAKAIPVEEVNSAIPHDAVIVAGLDTTANMRGLPVHANGDPAGGNVVPVAGVNAAGEVHGLPLRSATGADPTQRLVTVPPLAVQIYDSGDVAAGASINSGTLDLSRFTQVFAYAVNFDAAVARTLNANLVRDDATVRNDVNVTVPISGHGGVCLSRSVSGSGFNTPAKLRSFYLTAGGTSNGRMTIWGMPA